MKNPEVILGIDPGLATVGFAVLDVKDEAKIINFGVIETSSGLPIEERLQLIFKDLQILVDEYQPDLVLIEELFFSTNAKTALDVAQARGVLIAAVAEKGLPIRSIKPNQVKLGFTGDGSADKRQMQEMVKIHFGLTELPQPDDAADALAIAYVGYQEFTQELS
jgi:crossover junction endodeoxyribonuclease RuvC